MGSIQFENASVTYPVVDKEDGLPELYTSPQHTQDTKQTAAIKHGMIQKHTTCTLPTKQSTIEVKYFRCTNYRLSELKVEKKRDSFQLDTFYYKFCYHRESLWCPSDNTLDIYSLDGQLHMLLMCPQVKSINALHPLTETCMLLSAQSGLYTYDTTQQTVSNTLREGCSGMYMPVIHAL